jgi:hypothetical protein
VTTREVLAAAANNAPNVTCTPTYRVATKPGSAYVRLNRIEYPNRFGGVVWWDIVVILPSDIAAAEKWIEDNALGLVQALKQELAVTAVRPERIELVDGPTLPALFVEGHRAQEE